MQDLKLMIKIVGYQIDDIAIVLYKWFLTVTTNLAVDSAEPFCSFKESRL